MLASDFEKGLLFRKNEVNVNSSRSIKTPDEADSDDEWWAKDNQQRGGCYLRAVQWDPRLRLYIGAAKW